MFIVLFENNALILPGQKQFKSKLWNILLIFSKIHTFKITYTKLNQSRTYHYNLLRGYNFPYCNYIVTDIEIQRMEIDTV